MGRKRKTRNLKAADTTADCSRCNRNGEAFYCFKKNYIFDVDLARELVSDGREVFELDADDVNYSVDRVEINEGHLAHVDPAYPGIVAHLFFRDDDGTLIHAHRLIDGHHRATRCRRDGVPFRVHVLSERESVAILTRGPEGSKPDHLVGQDVPSATA